MALICKLSKVKNQKCSIKLKPMFNIVLCF